MQTAVNLAAALVTTLIDARSERPHGAIDPAHAAMQHAAPR